MRQRACNLDADGPEDDAPDPLLRFHDAVRVDGDDLVHERHQECESADRADEALCDENPVVDERPQLSHRGSSRKCLLAATPLAAPSECPAAFIDYYKSVYVSKYPRLGQSH